MRQLIAHALPLVLLPLSQGSAAAFQVPEQTAAEAAAAGANYQKYCALCHGTDREGYVNDHAPSLRSESLLSSGLPHHLAAATAYGRLGTPMGGYLDEIGGPMTMDEIYGVLLWLYNQEKVDLVRLPQDPVQGDVALGATVYGRECAECHGAEGEGAVGTALGNPVMLSMSTDHFLRYAIEKGREGTEMPSFSETLTAGEIDAVTAFLRSRATGWSADEPVLRSPPAPEEYIINPDAAAPEWDLKDDLYVMSADLLKALEEGRRMVILDTRVMSMWQMAHIEGAVPIPYYYDDLDALARDLPTDGTTIVLYCECPRAAAESVNRKLVSLGFENTAVLWEGIGGWVSLGYPTSQGKAGAEGG